MLIVLRTTLKSVVRCTIGAAAKVLLDEHEM